LGAIRAIRFTNTGVNPADGKLTSSPNSAASIG
jgi:hypothetical protein